MILVLVVFVYFIITLIRFKFNTKERCQIIMYDDGFYAVKWYKFPFINIQNGHFRENGDYVFYQTEKQAVEGMLLVKNKKEKEKLNKKQLKQKQKQFKNKTFSKEELDKLLAIKDII